MTPINGFFKYSIVAYEDDKRIREELLKLIGNLDVSIEALVDSDKEELVSSFRQVLSHNHNVICNLEEQLVDAKLQVGIMASKLSA